MHKQITCYRCGAGVEIGTDGMGHMVERVVVCLCDKPVRDPVGERNLPTPATGSCQDCGVGGLHQLALRCRPCRLAKDRRDNRKHREERRGSR